MSVTTENDNQSTVAFQNVHCSMVSCRVVVLKLKNTAININLQTEYENRKLILKYSFCCNLYF